MKTRIKTFPFVLKLATILLLAYTVFAGLLIPLGNGLKAVSPVLLPTGQSVELKVYAHNVAYTEQEALKARLRINESQALCVQTSRWNAEEQSLSLFFTLPAGRIPVDQTAQGRSTKSPFPLLEIYSPEQGYSSLEAAVFFQVAQGQEEMQADAQSFCAAESWTSDAKALQFPFLNILEETIRNLYFHVPMWFGMMLILLASVWNSIKVLRRPQERVYEYRASSYASLGVLFGVLGVLTGAIWAKNTWGSYWSWDVKQNTSAIALLIYLAYFVLRGSFDDADKKAKISAVYNIFAFSTLIPLLYVLPRLSDSLHPGMGGNPAFSSYDLDSSMRLVFYPSILAWTLLGFWIAHIYMRYQALREQVLEKHSF